MQGNYINQNIIPFQYVVKKTLSSSASGDQSLTLASDSRFELHVYRGQCSLDADNDFMPGNFSVKITDQSTGRLLQNDTINQRAICPYHGLRLLRPIIFPPNATLTFSFVNNIGSENNIEFILDGFKHFNI